MTDSPTHMGFSATGYMQFDPMFSLLVAVHGIACLLLIVGIIFLLRWILLRLTPTQLRNWGIGLVIVGALLAIVTSIWVTPYGRFQRMQNFEEKSETMNKTMKIMMMNDEKNDEESMTMNDMVTMLDGKTDDAFDTAFLAAMIVHHQGAIDMAKEALASAKHEEIKTMANEIISAQQREIDAMKAWEKSWGYTE